jgi:hypothetical protein
MLETQVGVATFAPAQGSEPSPSGQPALVNLRALENCLKAPSVSIRMPRLDGSQKARLIKLRIALTAKSKPDHSRNLISRMKAKGGIAIVNRKSERCSLRRWYGLGQDFYSETKILANQALRHIEDEMHQMRQPGVLDVLLPVSSAA